jgi:predicted PurR-regulated permease PerM
LYKSVKVDKKLQYSLMLLLIFLVATYIIKVYFEPFFIILVLFALAKPIYKFVVKIGFPNNISAIISIVIVNLVLFVFFLYGGKTIINSFDHFVLDNFPQINSKIKDMIYHYINYFKKEIMLLDFEIHTFIESVFNNQYLKKGAVFTTESISAYGIGNFITYFILIDGSKMLRFILKLFPGMDIDTLIAKKNVLNELIKTECIIVIATTIITIVVFLFLGISNPVFFGFLCGVLDIIPFVGTIILFAPIVLFNIYNKQYIISIALLLYYLLLQILRQIVDNHYISSKLNIHPLIILLSVYFGAEIFGTVGLIMGPLYVLFTKEFIFMD